MSCILLVDDEPLQLTLNKAILESEGYEGMAALDNLLAVIMTHAHFLSEELGAADSRLADVNEIAAAAARAAALTKQLLASMTVIGVGRVCNDLARMLQRLIGEDTELVMAVDERWAW